ncbi:6-carboxytetrahydropterin synthase [bacterium]|nr:6-carboxytetrahydropterin synthase [bacterium]
MLTISRKIRLPYLASGQSSKFDPETEIVATLSGNQMQDGMIINLRNVKKELTAIGLSLQCNDLLDFTVEFYRQARQQLLSSNIKLESLAATLSSNTIRLTKDMLTLSRSYEFAASHRLERNDWDREKNCQEFGNCSDTHGHNFVLTVSVGTATEAATPVLISPSELDVIVDQVLLREMDHKDFNSTVSFMQGKLPTIENIVQTCFERLAPHFQAPLKLTKLKLAETSNHWAEFSVAEVC